MKYSLLVLFPGPLEPSLIQGAIIWANFQKGAPYSLLYSFQNLTLSSLVHASQHTVLDAIFCLFVIFVVIIWLWVCGRPFRERLSLFRIVLALWGLLGFHMNFKLLFQVYEGLRWNWWSLHWVHVCSGKWSFSHNESYLSWQRRGGLPTFWCLLHPRQCGKASLHSFPICTVRFMPGHLLF